MEQNRRIQLLASASFVMGIVAFGLTIGDYLALHDISNEYVSKRILRYLDVELSKELPAWTETSGEWALVRLSLLARVCFFIFNGITLVLCLLASKQRRQRVE